MRIVPVLDVRGGRVVHADGGDRCDYPPISRRFEVPDEPTRLASRIEERLGSRLLYLADLDALSGRGRSTDLVGTLALAGHRLRVDAAVRDPPDARAVLEAGAEEVVVALETLPAWRPLEQIVEAVGGDRTVLSLDLRDGGPVGEAVSPDADPARLARRAAGTGVGRLLVLELSRVGGARGPDRELLRRCREAAPGVGLTAAGGIRDAGDVAAAARIGCDECMVATALYGGRLPPAAVRRLEREDG